MSDGENEIVNRVANSSLVTFDLETLYPEGELVSIDLTAILYQGLMLREKDLREFLKHHDWSGYQGKHVAVECSSDAVIPTWAFMLIGIALEPFAATIIYGNKTSLLTALYQKALARVDWEKFRDQKVVIKGCGDKYVPESAYVDAVTRLRPLAASLMYGEPCSTVPLYKKSK